MRFHLFGLAHLPTSKLYGGCAFTQKSVKLAKMLTEAGHEVFVYGCKSIVGPQPVCTEFVETHTVADIRADYGDGCGEGPFKEEIGYDWQDGQFRHDINTDRKPSTQKFAANAIVEICRRKRADDFLLVTQGFYQKDIADAVGLWLTVEPGIGYRGSWCQYRAFESAYIQNFTYGSEHPRQSINGSYWDRVIPNYFEEEDVLFGRGPRGGYYLYIGRMISRKGIQTAIRTCNEIGAKLILAGQGAKVLPDGTLKGEDFTEPPGSWEYIGYADWDSRKELFANAIATFVPTLYLEPFAGTHVESMLSGTPVITTDFGVFPETVQNGVNGFRCHMLKDFVHAAEMARETDPFTVRSTAERFLCKNVVHQYTKWFSELHQLYRSAHEPGVKAWSRLKDDSTAQEWERAWWGNCANTLGEEEKQLVYARLMGIEFHHDGKTPYAIDLNGKSVIDIGGGPASLLLKAANGKMTVIDPCDYPEWVADRYAAAGIVFHRMRGEDISEGQFDEAWIYNVLQHVNDPAAVAENARRIARVVRVFEWISVPQSPGHPHVLTQQNLERWFGGHGDVVQLNENGCVGTCWVGVFSGLVE